MLDILWVILLCGGVLYAAISGTMPAVSDSIMPLAADAATLAAVDAHRELVQGETLTRELELVEATDLDVTVAVGDA